MKQYLLDTNAFFEMLSFLAGKSVRKDGYDFSDIRKGKCYVSKITERNDGAEGMDFLVPKQVI